MARSSGGAAVRQAVAAFHAGRKRQAIKSLKQHLKRAALDPEGWRVLAEMQNRTDDPAGARRSLERAVALEPGRAPTLALLGITLIKLGRLREAEARFRQALAIDHGDVDAWVNLASCLRLQNRVLAATRAYREAADRAPGDAEVWLALGRTLQSAAHDLGAAEAFARAAALAPGRLDALVLQANALIGAGRLDDGLEIARRTAAAFPRDASAQSALADLLRSLGRLGEAAEAYRRALALAPGDSAATLGLSHVARPGADDPIVVRARARLEDRSTTARERMVLAFATGSFLEHQGRHEAAFEHFLEGNRIKRKSLAFSVTELADDFAAARSLGPGPAIAAPSVPPRPILIVGMPRSGTTLVEQILASHPGVAAGGELPLLSRLVGDLPDLLGDAVAGPAALSAQQQMRCAASYRAGLTERAQGRALVTDKSPLNFRYLGWAAALLPDARIIHCRRDPLDTCVSCFCRLFGEGRAEFSYDLSELGTAYRHYNALMDHWHRVLPDRILDLSYEALVADQETGSRRLLSFCGLDWDPSVLAFHQTRRAVRTASASQIRAPITAASVGRWRRYEAFLEPLKTALGPLASG